MGRCFIVILFNDSVDTAATTDRMPHAADPIRPGHLMELQHEGQENSVQVTFFRERTCCPLFTEIPVKKEVINNNKLLLIIIF